jgi:CBS domain-containing protein
MQASVFARRVRDYMETTPLSVSPTTPLLAVQRLLVDADAHDIPVVDHGTVVGTISSLDLVRLSTDETDIATISLPSPEAEPDVALLPLTAADAMDRELVSVTPAASLVDAARVMHEQHIHRLLVIEDGVLLGVITSFDLLREFTRGRRYSGQIIDFDPCTARIA